MHFIHVFVSMKMLVSKTMTYNYILNFPHMAHLQLLCNNEESDRRFAYARKIESEQPFSLSAAAGLAVGPRLCHAPLPLRGVLLSRPSEV